MPSARLSAAAAPVPPALRKKRLVSSDISSFVKPESTSGWAFLIEREGTRGRIEFVGS
jgi:hypothetical protein